MKALTPAQRQQFEDEGYVVVDGVLDPARDIQPIMSEFAEVLDGIAASRRRWSPRAPSRRRTPSCRSATD